MPCDTIQGWTVAIRRFLALHKSAKCEKVSIARKMARLRRFFKFAQRWGFTASKPAQVVRTPKRKRRATCLTRSLRHHGQVGREAPLYFKLAFLGTAP